MGRVARRRKQFVSLHRDGEADWAELIHAKGRFNVASDELGSDLAAYALIPGVDLGEDYYVTRHRYWQETRQEIQALHRHQRRGTVPRQDVAAESVPALPRQP